MEDTLMARYHIRHVAKMVPKADEDYHFRPLPTFSHPMVYASEPHDTGLLNVDGHPIMKGPDQVGFVRSSVTTSTKRRE